MSNSGSKVLMLMLTAVFLVAIVNAARPVIICNVDSSRLTQCLPAVSGRHPRPPTRQCCAVIRHANLRCLCGYKSALSAFGINPRDAMALPKKCGMRSVPAC